MRKEKRRKSREKGRNSPKDQLMHFFIHTMGCKLNRYDSAVVAGLLSPALIETGDPEEADLIILNTCTVTHKAEREARRLARSLKRRNREAKVVVMGCSTRFAPEAYRIMEEVDEVITGPEELRALAGTLGIPPSSQPAAKLRFNGRTRAFLKVQEGCNYPCTYCIIPKVRGRSVSVPEEEVRDDFLNLLEDGYREIVLTGVNTGEWGRDLGGNRRLEDLLSGLLELEGDFRIRLNSVEPRAVTPGLIALLRKGEKLAKHLHVPLQSGSDPVLKAMRRNYRSGFYSELLARIAEEVPAIGIGVDVIAGFPTETAEDFGATLSLLEESPVAFLHAFSYSPRAGTPASRLTSLPAGEIASRVRALRELGAEKKRKFAGRFIGKELRALTLGSGESAKRALTGNFLDVTLSGETTPNRFINIIVKSVEDGIVRAGLR